MNCKGSSVVLSFFMRPLPLVFDSRLVETIFFLFILFFSGMCGSSFRIFSLNSEIALSFSAATDFT